jgi:hypothetical protein
MRLKRTRRRISTLVSGPPEGAHGQRTVDDSYFSVWRCQHGHHTIGEVDTAPTRTACFGCVSALLQQTHEGGPPEWTRCSMQEAHDYIFELEGFKMYSGVGFKMLPLTTEREGATQ